MCDFHSQVEEKVSETEKLKLAEKIAERIVCKYCPCEFSRDAAYERHLRKHKHEERQIEMAQQVFPIKITQTLFKSYE